MGHGQHRGALAQGATMLRQIATLGFGIERAGHLVQDQQLRPADQRPGQGDALPLAARQPRALGADHGLHALGQLRPRTRRRRPAAAPPRPRPRYGRCRSGSGSRGCWRGTGSAPAARSRPCCRQACSSISARSTPSIRIRPPCGRCRPSTRSISVVLPAPDMPVSTVMLPAGTAEAGAVEHRSARRRRSARARNGSRARTRAGSVAAGVLLVGGQLGDQAPRPRGTATRRSPPAAGTPAGGRSP